MDRALARLPTSAPSPCGSADGEQWYPRMGTKIRIGFSNSARTWEESADLVELLNQTLSELGHAIGPHDDGLLYRSSGMVLHAELCGFQPHHPSGLSTATVI